jgi:UTP--glucose-1-phosphate uridylyltransferase
MVEAWDQGELSQIMVERVSSDGIENYGVDNLGDRVSELFKSVPLKGLVEKPLAEDAPSNLAILGRYILPSGGLDILETVAAGLGGEIQLTDALDKLTLSCS